MSTVPKTLAGGLAIMRGRVIALLALSLGLLAGAPGPASGETWALQFVDVGSASGISSSLGLIQGYPVIAYSDALGNLKYAALNPQTLTWNLLRVDAGGGYTSLAVDAAGIVHVAYLGATGQLKYWKNNQGQGLIQVIDSETGLGGMGFFNSIQVDGSGVPRVSYYYWKAPDGLPTADRLKFAFASGSSWARTFADPTFGRGRYNSLGLDALGTLYIAYFDGTARRLRLANGAGGIFATQVVDSVGEPGYFNSIAIDRTTSLPRISYIAGTSFQLRYASALTLTPTTSTWSFQDVAGVGPIGDGSVTSLALDSAGNPHISYYDAATTSLKYASRAGGVWTVQTVDSAGDVGAYSSLKLDSSDRPIISYYDATTSALKIAYGNYLDQDGDGIPDVLDSCPSNPDCNSNGIVDGREGGVTQNSQPVARRLPGESIFGCGSLAAMYGSGPPRGGPPPLDLLFLLAPAAYLLRWRFASRARRARPSLP